MVGVNGGKLPAIRKHLAENIGGVYKDMDLSWVKEYDIMTATHDVFLSASRSSRSKGRLTPRLVSTSVE